jgi:phosphate transport system substrate-binding protein
LLTDATGPDAYPVMATSFVLIRRYGKQSGTVRDLLGFFRWALETGQEQAASLDYLPLPQSLVRQVEAYWESEIH